MNGSHHRPLSGHQMDNGRGCPLFVKVITRFFAREAGRYRHSVGHQPKLFVGVISSHAFDEEDIGSRMRSREDSRLRVVGVADVGGNGVVDDGAVRSHVEGIGGVVSVESHVVLDNTWNRRRTNSRLNERSV